MTIFGAIATITSLRARERQTEEWIDACVQAHIEQGLHPEEARRACRRMIAEAEHSHDP